MKINSHKSYTLVTGIILFLLGFLGFAFRQFFENIGTGYLLAALILGFWGIVLFFSARE